MKKTFSAIAVVAMSMALGAVAAGVSQEKTPETQRPGAADAKGITLTGCVARGTTEGSYTLAETKDGTAGAASATATTPAGAASATATTAAGAPSATATTPAGAPSAAVMLTGTEVDLSKHVGHTVALTGVYASADMPTGTAGTDKPATAGAAVGGDKKMARSFAVKSLKMVSATCASAK